MKEARKDKETKMHWNVKDITGQKFGRLTVIRRSGTSKQREVIWECRCDCGTVKDIRASHLSMGRTQSCGCYHKDMMRETRKGKPSSKRLPAGVAAFNHLFASYKSSAAQRGLSWELTKEECLSLYQSPCYYCGALPNCVTYPSTTDKKHGGAFIFNGIDRVDNSLGYTSENVVTCCKDCNYAKRDRSLAEFKEWVTRLHQHMTANGLIEKAGLLCKHQQALSLQREAGVVGKTDKATPKQERQDWYSANVNRDF